MKLQPYLYALGLVTAACGHVPAGLPGEIPPEQSSSHPGVPTRAPARATTVAFPRVDHHAHLLSPAAAALVSEQLQPAVRLPAELAHVLDTRARHWNERATMAELYTREATVLDVPRRRWLSGRDEVAPYMSEALFSRGYSLVPFRYNVDGSSAHIAAYFVRGEGAAARPFGHVLLSLVRGRAGPWRIAAEAAAFPGPTIADPVRAEDRVADMDAAWIQRAVVLSTAYWFGSPLREGMENEYASVQAENDWTAAEAARFPDRLIAFCSFNPLREYALAELDRCAAHPDLRGLKLHFANSGVDVRDVRHVEQLRRVFRSANDHGLPIAVHLWVPGEYGREDAEIFLNQILPEAPDVVVQIAHFAGGGPGYTDAALAVYAEAIAAADVRTRQLYFDIATVADMQPAEALQTLATRIRQVGVERVLFGVDAGRPISPAPRESWLIFRSTVPLLETEFTTIANNVAPYLR